MSKFRNLNFLIVGAAKSGTTSVYHYLKQHPEVYLTPVKEPCFWVYYKHDGSFNPHTHATTTIQEYSKLFKKAGQEKAVGEASAIYLHKHENVIKNLKKLYPGWPSIKIIIYLRNPVQRAFSQYMMHVRDGKEDLSFEEAIEAETKRKEECWNIDYYYMERGLYYQQVKAYLDNFDDVLILLFDDLQKDPVAIFKQVEDFLDINPGKNTIEKKVYNRSGRPKIKWLTKTSRFLVYKNNPFKKTARFLFPKKLRKKMSYLMIHKLDTLNLRKEKMNHKTEKKLKEFYKPDIQKLEELLKKDLSHWYK